jgi:hypothetical protein
MRTSPRMSYFCFIVFFSTTAMSSSLAFRNGTFFHRSYNLVERLIIVLAGMISPFSSPLLPLSPVEPLPSCLCHLERISCKVIGVDWPEPAVDQNAPSASVIVFQGNGCFLAIAEALSRQLSAKGILVKGEPLSGDISKNGL